MAKRARRAFSAPLKAKVALAALREDKTLVELAKQYELYPNQITEWERQLVERAVEVFSGGRTGPPVDLKPLHAKIGQQALEIDFLAGTLGKAGLLSPSERSTANLLYRASGRLNWSESVVAVCTTC
jgi:transposase